MTDNTENRIADLEAQLAELRAELKAKQSPRTPVPSSPAKPPSWAPQHDNCGMNYTGEPSHPGGGGISWVRQRRANGDWLDPNSGQWRDSSGAAVPVTPETRPLAADDQRLRGNVELLDQLLERDEQLRERR
jgi:hypothetical protein